MKTKLPKLYAITDRKKFKKPFEQQIKDFLERGIKIIQIREKDLPSGELYKLSKSTKEISKNYKDSFIIINDRVDIAVILGLSGVHLPENSIPIKEIKNKFPELIVGKSCHSIDSALKAEKEGADYVIFSPIFYVEGKGKPQGLEKLEKLVNMLSIPVYALGGINKSNMEKVWQTGVHGIAGIRTFLGYNS